MHKSATYSCFGEEHMNSIATFGAYNTVGNSVVGTQSVLQQQVKENAKKLSILFVVLVLKPI